VRLSSPVFRVLGFIAGALLVAVFILLGNWQLGRAQDKEALRLRIETLRQEPPVLIAAATADPAFMDWRPVAARGSWVADRTILVDNKMHRGKPGFHVVTPLKLEGGMHVLVYRGWVAAPRLRSELPQFTTPAGIVEVTGVARAPRGRFVELSSATREGNIWENLTVERFRAWAGMEVQPVVIRQTGPAEDGLARDWEPPDVNATKHRFIAFQWYAFAVMLPAAVLILLLRRRKKEEES
jgi:surfeit locus 1 family protein